MNTKKKVWIALLLVAALLLGAFVTAAADSQLFVMGIRVVRDGDTDSNLAATQFLNATPGRPAYATPFLNRAIDCAKPYDKVVVDTSYYQGQERVKVWCVLLLPTPAPTETP